MDRDLALAERVRDLMRRDGLTLAAMESCTGGLIASMLTDAEGAGYFRGGAVTYDVKVKYLFGVPPLLVQQRGVVSVQVAASMAERVAAQFHADCGIGVTGVAGPGPEGGVPAGTAFAAVALPDGRVRTKQISANADREGTKGEIARQAIALLVEALESPCPRRNLGSEAWVG